jgi:hypothetical protein
MGFEEFSVNGLLKRSIPKFPWIIKRNVYRQNLLTKTKTEPFDWSDSYHVTTLKIGEWITLNNLKIVEFVSVLKNVSGLSMTLLGTNVYFYFYLN